MRLKVLKSAIGWTCSVIVALELALFAFAVITLQHAEPISFRDLSGPAPWFWYRLSAGTGVFIDPNGDILTNDHVVDGCRGVTVAGSDFQAVRARIVAVNDNDLQDLAVIHIDRASPDWLAMEAEPEPVGAGDLRVPLPTPISTFGFPGSMKGVVPKEEPVTNLSVRLPTGDRSWQHWIFTVIARVEPGSSGSPVVDGQGQIAGLMMTGTFPDHHTPEKAMIAESGEAVYGRYITDWLARSNIHVPPRGEHVVAHENVSKAVVRVFCFGKQQ